jgi:hypothetical protein
MTLLNEDQAECLMPAGAFVMPVRYRRGLAGLLLIGGILSAFSTCPIQSGLKFVLSILQYVARPPLKSNTAPVVNEFSSEANHATIDANSSTNRKRPRGIFASM